MEITEPLYSNSLKHFITGISRAAKDGLMEVSDAERLTRVLMSQGNDRFAQYFVTSVPELLAQPEVAEMVSRKLATPIANAQRGLNYSFGTEGHHAISVSSIEAASRHLPFEQRLEFLKALRDNYTYSGTDPEDMVPLTGISHQQKGAERGTDTYNAHFDSDPKTLINTFKPNQGTWQQEDFTDITDPTELAHEFWRRSGEPQVRAAEIAFDQPGEIAFRERAASELGIRERDLYLSGTKNGKPIAKQNRKALDKAEFKGETVIQAQRESFGQNYTPPQPRTTPRAPLPEKPKRPWAESKVLNPQPVAPRPAAVPSVPGGLMPNPNVTRGRVAVAAATRKIPRSALAALPVAGAVLGIADAANAASRGNYKQAGAIAAETVAGEIPVIGDVVQSSPVADGTLTAARARASQPKPKPNGFVRAVDTIDKIITNPVNEIKWGFKGLSRLMPGSKK